MFKTLVKWAAFLLILFGLHKLYDRYFVRGFEISGGFTGSDDPSIKVEKVQIQSFNDKGMVRFRLFGSEARFLEKEGKVEVRPVNLLIYDDEIEYMQEIAILAREGYHYEAKPPFFELIGDVECNIAVATDVNNRLDSIQYIRKVFTSKLLYYPDLQKFVSPGKFKVIDTKNNSVITGDSFIYYGQRNSIEVQGNVESVFQEHPDLVLEELKRGFHEGS